MKIQKKIYIPKVEVAVFCKNINLIVEKLNGNKNIEYASSLEIYNNEEVIVFYIICHGDTEEAVNKEYATIKELISTYFDIEVKEM